MNFNDPEYFLVDDIGTLIGLVKSELELPVLEYRFGYLKELNQTLQQMNESPEHAFAKYPLAWVLQPFKIQRGISGFYGVTSDLRIFIINQSNKEAKAPERMESNFKPIIYPIYRELLKQIDISINFSTQGIPSIKHSLIDRYWIRDLGLDDTVDCLEINGLELRINNNPNCTPFKSW